MLHLRSLYPDIDGLRPSRFELGFSLSDIGTRSYPHRIPVSGYLERLSVGFDSFVQQFLLCIQGPQLEVILGQRGLGGEPQGLQRGGACLGVAGIRFDLPTDAAPQVRLPGHVQGGSEQVSHAGHRDALAGGSTEAGDRRGRRAGRDVRGASRLN
jgi:hypothetical protein